MRNTGTVVDSFTVTVLGDAALWTSVAPQVLSLFPGAEGTVDLHFAPPRKPELTAGVLPFGVRVVPSEDDAGSVVEEGSLEVLPFREMTARITPRTTEAKRSSRHQIVVDNRGNAPMEAELSATDPDEQLAFDLRPSTLTVAPGHSARATIKVAARKGFARGADKHRPFQVRVTTGPTETPALLDATLVQKAGFPRFVFPLVAAAVTVALLAAVLPTLRKDGGGAIMLTGGSQATTTTAAPEEEIPVEDPAQAAAEAEAAAAAERAANGRDADSVPAQPPGETRSGEAVASASDSPAAGGGVEPTTDGSPEPDAPVAAPQAPVATTTTTTTTTKPSPPGAAPTTTTTPPAYTKWAGTWVNTNTATREQPQAVIRNDSTHIYVHGYGACTPTYCDWGEARTTVADGNDNTLNIVYNFGFKTTEQTISYLSASRIRIQSTHRYTDGRATRTSDETFNRK
ncbi:MAG: hypothetical protein KY454_04580 [Actinobacteria bacterium]|nr:hypothetical protein [Actinomycetota bacterium]MBW3651100.1 hypothetical protein [Actinomycetota bacterium]